MKDMSTRIKIREVFGLEQIPLVEEQPVYNRDGNQIVDYKAVVDCDSQEVIAINSKDYKLIQHKDVAASVLQLMSKQVLEPIKMRTIGDTNRRMFMTAQMPDLVEVHTMNGIEVLPVRLEIVNSYDRSTSLIVMPSTLRLKCMNVLYGLLPGEFHNFIGMAKREQNIPDGIKRTHKGTDELNLTEYLRKKIDHAIVLAKQSGDFWSKMDKIKVDHEAMKMFIDLLKFPEKHSEEIRNQYDENHPTLWSLYNAATYVTTHCLENPERQETFQNIIKRETIKYIKANPENIAEVA
jgi:hypothetical protein